MTKDSEHLEWIYARLIVVYGENEHVDYMARFKKIINTIENREQEDE